MDELPDRPIAVDPSQGGPKVPADLAKMVMDDVRHRQKAQLDLMFQIDRQAMTFFGFSLSAAIATGTTAASFISSQRLLLAACLAICFVGFLAAATLSWWALKTVKIHVPGREFAFWKWALDNPSADIARAYAEAAQKTYEENRDIGNRAAIVSNYARNAAAISTLIAAATGTLAALIVS